MVQFVSSPVAKLCEQRRAPARENSKSTTKDNKTMKKSIRKRPSKPTVRKRTNPRKSTSESEEYFELCSRMVAKHQLVVERIEKEYEQLQNEIKRHEHKCQMSRVQRNMEEHLLRCAAHKNICCDKQFNRLDLEFLDAQHDYFMARANVQRLTIQISGGDSQHIQFDDSSSCSTISRINCVMGKSKAQTQSRTLL